MSKLRLSQDRALPKAATGIAGLDEITGGGLPRGRPTLVCGGAGCGKTLLAMEFLVRGATQFDEPGVFMAFEETAEELAQNVRSLGFDLDDLVARKKLLIDYVRVERSEIEETGEYDLEGLFVRLGHAIDSIGAKRVVLDTIETLFSGLSQHRHPARRAAPAVPLAEGQGRHRDHHRRARRWHAHPPRPGGVRLRLRHRARPPGHRAALDPPPAHRQVPRLGPRHQRVPVPDRRGRHLASCRSPPWASSTRSRRSGSPPAFPGSTRCSAAQGFYRGSSVLVSGTAGTGKTSLAAHFADAACRRGERCLYFAFEESREPDHPQHALHRHRPGAAG